MLAAGCFVSVKSNAWGTGKLLRFEPLRREAEVEYFDSPTTVQRPTIKCAVTDLQWVRELKPETRVYYYDRTAVQWRMGRISGHVDTYCYISLPNQEQAKVSQEEVFVRWYLPPIDPTDQLKVMLTETPFFQTQRRALVAHLVRQRAVAPGLTALLAAPLFLEKHQLEVVRRILADPVQRYLLADEVGLGKTIEAGMIARQHVLDQPDKHCVLVVVPSALVNQWWLELIGRCQIGGSFGHNVGVLSYEDYVKRDDLQPDLLIVDEAHQLARPERSALFRKLRIDSDPAVCPKLLLLSATPVRGNELGFLSLLHLLDPTLYRLDEAEDFQARVAQRQELADIFVTLAPDQDDYFLEQTVTGAKNLFPRDMRLQALADELMTAIGKGESGKLDRERLVSTLRIHLAETYRLDRRFLRNRRSEEINGLLPGRDGLRIIADEGETIKELESMVELWRAQAVQACAGTGTQEGDEWNAAAKQFMRFLEAAWISPEKFIGAVKRRQSVVNGSKEFRNAESFPPLEDEIALLDGFIEQAQALERGHDAKLESIANTAITSASVVSRVVVMCTDTAMADAIFRRIGIRSEIPVFRCAPLKEHPETWLQKGIVICDGIAEEGLNLQGGSTHLLHVDLPFSPNRLEQRMGRLDRIGKGKAVCSLTLLPSGAIYLTGWLEVLDRGWEVFNRSIASLQYVVEDEMKTLRQELFAEGSSAFGQSLLRLSGEEGVIARELRAIRNQDELDSLSTRSGETEALITGIEAYEKTADDFSHALNQWLCEGLGFIRVGQREVTDLIGRYHYCRPGKGKKSTLVSETDFLHWFRRGLDESATHPTFTRPLSWLMVTRRETALSHRVGVARLGHPWIDAVAEYLRWDDRGTAVAFWRVHPHADTEARPYFRFAAVVEADHDRLTDWCKKNPWANRFTISRLADAAFPPAEINVWVDPEFTPPTSVLLPVLERAYNKATGDTNLRGQRWARALTGLSLSAQGWMDHCIKARTAAEAMVSAESQLTGLIASRLEQRAIAYREVNDQLLSRREALGERPEERARLDRDIQRHSALHAFLQESIKEVKIRFDSGAAVVLSRQSLP